MRYRGLKGVRKGYRGLQGVKRVKPRYKYRDIF